MTLRTRSTVSISAPAKQVGGRQGRSAGAVPVSGLNPTVSTVSTRGGRKARPATASRGAPARGGRLLAAKGAGRSPSRRFPDPRGRSSAGRASGCQSEGRGSESRRPLITSRPPSSEARAPGRSQETAALSWPPQPGGRRPLRDRGNTRGSNPTGGAASITYARVAQMDRAPAVPEADRVAGWIGPSGGPRNQNTQGVGTLQVSPGSSSINSRFGRTRLTVSTAEGAGSPLERCHCEEAGG